LYDLRVDFLKYLNEEQKEVVLFLSGPILVIAGPGSGKTRIIEYRVLNLVQEGINPQRILLLTFTKRAAGEMLERVARHNRKCLLVEGGTFHSFAYKLIKKYGKILNPKFNGKLTVLDQSDSEELIGKILKDFGDLREKLPQKDTLRNIFSLVVNKNLSLEKVIEKQYFQFEEQIENIRKVLERYEERKRENNYVDFDDLLVFSRNILKSKEGKMIGDQYDFVMVDEYQDTNPIQGEITYLLGKYTGNILVVGDDAQSIYAFRGASHKNIMEFPNLFPNTKIIKLEKNYRSTQSILDLSNEVLFNMESKFQKNLIAANEKRGKKPTLLCFENFESEAQWIVSEVLQLLEKGILLKEQAVLFRSNYISILLQTELAKHKIPFKVFGGIKFYEMAHIKDFLAFLKVINNFKDEISWGRVFSILEGIGKKTEEKLILEVKKTSNLNELVNLFQNFNGSKLVLLELQKLKNLLLEVSKNYNPTLVVNLIFNFYLPYFKEKFDDWPMRLDDLETLKNIAKDYESIELFLADISIEMPENLKFEKDFVTLSTIHSAKGLEWRAVFLMGVADDILPSYKSQTKEEIEEEERLLYVAITRAKEKLYLTFNLEKNKNFYFKNLSRFLKKENILNLLELVDFSENNFLNEIDFSGENEIYLE